MMPDLRSLNQPFNRSLNVEGKEYLYFGGTAYLGIPQNEQFASFYIEGIRKFGLNNGTSRNNNIQLGIYNEAEATAASRFGAAGTLITSSGYLAAQLTVKALSDTGTVVYAPSTHPALWTENTPTDHQSFTSWTQQVSDQIRHSPEKNWVLISNSMNNLYPEIYDFNFLKQLPEDKNITLIVDDSHGIGINQQGRGVYTALPKQHNIRPVVVASMAKALGVDAGLILAEKELINKLKNSNEFLGASPPAAAALYAFIKSEGLYTQAWDKLQRNIQILTPALGKDWKYVQGFPAFYTEEVGIEERLFKNRVLISSFPYPTKTSAPVNRIVLSSWHEEADLTTLIRVLRQ